MRFSQDRLHIVATIQSAAKIYKNELVGRKFLYVFDGRFIEVIFKVQNFKHLTGVISPLPASEFFRKAIRNQLSVNQISFSSDHPYELCCKKIKHICDIATLAGSECFMLEKITTKSRSYKFGTTDLRFSICFDQPRNEQWDILNETFLAESLRDEDCFSKNESAYSVTCILSKPNDQKKYNNLLFCEPSCSICAIPEAVRELMSDKLLNEVYGLE